MNNILSMGVLFLSILTIIAIGSLFLLDYQYKQYFNHITPYIHLTSTCNCQKESLLKNDKILTQDIQLLLHPFYERFELSPRVNKRKLSLVLIVSSSPHRFDRRQGIRNTWWKDCHSKYEKTVECLFMTDKLDESHELYDVIQNEIEQYKDIHLQNLPTGFFFGHRMIYHMLFAMLNYDFDYFLRADDDYFLCIDQLIHELPKKRLQRFHWGWVHQQMPNGIYRPEESMIMLSRDVVTVFLSQNYSSLYCHPLADQMIMFWSHKLGLNDIYRHDKRLHHIPIFSQSPELKDDKQICEKYIGIHGVYSKDMIHLWNNKGNRLAFGNKTLYENSESVNIPNEGFCWSCFYQGFKFEPRLCIEDYNWDTSHLMNGTYFGGRQDGLGK